MQALEKHDAYYNFHRSVLVADTAGELASTLGGFLKAAQPMIGHDAGIVYLADETTQTLRCFATLGCGRAFSPKEFKFRFDDKSVACHARSTRRPFIIPILLNASTHTSGE
jgi:hypothetical protein